MKHRYLINSNDRRVMAEIEKRGHNIWLTTMSREFKPASDFLLMDKDLIFIKPGGPETIASSGHSFAVMCLDSAGENLTMRISWLEENDGILKGKEQLIMLDYQKLMSFLSKGDGKYKMLCEPSARILPEIKFSCPDTISRIAENKKIRKKFARAIGKSFHWPNVGIPSTITLYPDFDKYSFFFEEVIDGRKSLSGGFILHRPEKDPKQMRYSIHT